MRPRIPMPAGSRYGSLTIVTGNQMPHRTQFGTRAYLAVWCHCDCGDVVQVHSKNLRSGNTQSCGCKAHWKRKTA